MQTDADVNENSIPPLKKAKKNVTEFTMPTKENYSILLSQNYTIKQ